MKKQMSSPPVKDEQLISSFGIQRRNMLKFFGASAAVVALSSACNNDDDDDPIVDNSVFLGAGDFQILNFAYALEQLEAAFYTQVVTSAGFNAMSAIEKTYMMDIKDHEVAHREFFKAALGTNAIKGLTPKFTAVDFSSRAGILAQAKAFEDTGVAAYNGAGQYLTDVNYLLAAGKIVSVEARHAALIRDLISFGTFSDDLDANALEISKPPTAIVDIANAFLTADSQISKRGLPA